MTTRSDPALEASEVLARYQDLKVAFLFGSVARGAARPDSDMDVGVAAAQPLTAAQKLTLMDALAEACGRPVDLVDLRTAEPLLLCQILTTGTCVLKRDVSLYAELLRRLWYDQADLMPSRELILRRRRERFLYGG